METFLDRDTSIYRANRLFVGLMIFATGGLGALVFLPAFEVFLRTGRFRGTFAFLGSVPPDVRVWLAHAVAAGMIAVGLLLCRVLFNPRLVTVDAKGIEVRKYFSVHRGRWRDFVGMKAIGIRGVATVQLRFKKSAGFRTRVNLPPPALGVNLREVVADVAWRLMERKGPEVSLDKFDPKKLAKQAPPEPPREPTLDLSPEPPRDPTLDLSPEPSPFPVAAAPRRRSFGKRKAV